ncbi:hypothetical protein C0J52_01452 [Blattella germanica]|nr:hypothetical protein C0J52_01452 [Blattella germanica]
MLQSILKFTCVQRPILLEGRQGNMTSLAYNTPQCKNYDVWQEKFVYKHCSTDGRWEGRKPGLYTLPQGYTNYTTCYTREMLELIKKLYSGSEDAAKVLSGDPANAIHRPGSDTASETTRYRQHACPMRSDLCAAGVCPHRYVHVDVNRRPISPQHGDSHCVPGEFSLLSLHRRGVLVGLQPHTLFLDPRRTPPRCHSVFCGRNKRQMDIGAINIRRGKTIACSSDKNKTVEMQIQHLIILKAHSKRRRSNTNNLNYIEIDYNYYNVLTDDLGP